MCSEPPGRDLDCLIAAVLGYGDASEPCCPLLWFSRCLEDAERLLAMLHRQGVAVQYPVELQDGSWGISTADDPPLLVMGETAAHAISLMFLAVHARRKREE